MTNLTVIFVTQLLLLVIAISVSNYPARLRNISLRVIVFKDKRVPKILQPLRNICNRYYDKSIVTIADAFDFYSKLSDEDKLLLDTILSLCY